MPPLTDRELEHAARLFCESGTLARWRDQDAVAQEGYRALVRDLAARPDAPASYTAFLDWIRSD